MHILLNAKYKFKKGYNLKNIGSRVMGLVGYDVEFDCECIFQVSS